MKRSKTIVALMASQEILGQLRTKVGYGRSEISKLVPMLLGERSPDLPEEQLPN